MKTWIDFRKLREQLNFVAVFRFYKVEVKLKGDQHHGFCPLPTHNGKRNSPSFSANVAKGIWQCFGCGAKGNVLDFAVRMEGGNPESGEDVQRVALKLQEQFFGAAPPPAKSEKRKSDDDGSTIINAPLDFTLKGLDANHPYLRKRGLTPESIEKFGLGYCSRGLLKGRVAIPLFEQGNLIGYAGRVVDDAAINEENPKYRFPGTREHNGKIYEFRKSLFLYNGNRITAPVNDLAVVEGFASVWWLTQAGIGNVVATMGAACSEEQAKLIVSLVAPSGRVWICSDGDKAGMRCAETLLALVAPHRFVRWVRLVEGKQPTGLSPLELKERLPF